jgi:hypothetical protein
MIPRFVPLSDITLFQSRFIIQTGVNRPDHQLLPLEPEVELFSRVVELPVLVRLEPLFTVADPRLPDRLRFTELRLDGDDDEE